MPHREPGKRKIRPGCRDERPRARVRLVELRVKDLGGRALGVYRGLKGLIGV